MTTIEFSTLDVFTDSRFGGNPLAVIPDATGLTDDLMRRIASEFNLSETVFVLPPNAGGARRLRIFTPAEELPFAGHPTVGTAVLLVGLGLVPEGDFVLEEGVGPIAVTVTTGDVPSAQFTAAQRPSLTDAPAADEDLAAAVGLRRDDLVGASLPPQISSCGTSWLILPVSDDALSRARLDIAVWEQHLAGTPGANVYLVTPPVDSQTRARMFGYAIGVIEDPATGAAAAALAGYLGARQPDGTSRWTITQGVEMGRPSRLHIEADVDSRSVMAVRVGGSAVRVADGTMRIS